MEERKSGGHGRKPTRHAESPVGRPRPVPLIGARGAAVGTVGGRRAGLPLFVDKPLVDTEEDLKTFSAWVREGAAIMSSSAMRYSKEYVPYHGGLHHELGELRLVHITMQKKWETYGIHALEAVYPILGPGFLSARNTGSARRNIVHLRHSSAVDVLLMVHYDMLGGSGLHLCGTAGHVALSAQDTFFSFKGQLLAFVDYLRSGRPLRIRGGARPPR